MNAAVREGDGAGMAETAAPGPAALAGMMSLALAIRESLEGESEEGRVAVACAMRNRMRRFGLDRADMRGAAARARDLSDPLLCRALAFACFVLSGDPADPTGGATHFHRHTEQPKWARSATPKALIGQHIFYALDAKPGA